MYKNASVPLQKLYYFRKKISLKASEGEFFHVVGLYIELGLDSLCENSE
jgi:hypothetical protein